MNRKNLLFVITLCCCYLMTSGFLNLAFGANSALLGWNNLGMHCMDSDYSVFSILPPYNTIEAQLIVGGKLVKSGAGYTLTYEAIADPDGSINSTSVGKGNWNQFESIIYGVPSSFTADNGLIGWNMPGLANAPQQMKFETLNSPAAGVSTSTNWFRAEGIPLTPYDDKGNKNPYPLMRLVARDATNQVIATSDIVLPVSDEMDCSSCHGSGTQTAAQPTAGWVFAPIKDRDYRLNILRLHDEHQFSQHAPLYKDALAAKGFDPTGLYATAMSGKPMMCAACHASEALGAPSFSSSNGTVPPLTSSVHTLHATVQDPVLNLTLNASDNRAACYRCHPGSTTRCLRGAMGSAVAADGSMAMQCQSCHGTMSQVGSSSRVGWFMEPACQSCHTGTATNNNGQIRYTNVFDTNGQPRVAVDQTFATTPDTPAAGLSLYRFSAGHGGLQCSSCHGSTHAEFPASNRNDNIRNIQLQGHAGMAVECTSCHATMPTSPNGGPHGMHPIGQSWVSGHHDSISLVGVAECKNCHGADYRGTVLSRVQGSRTLTVGDSGTQISFYRGATVGCYTCHNGPSSDSMNSSAAPAVNDVTAQTAAGQPVTIVLPVSGTNAVLRVISQPASGTVGLSGNTATYFPFDGFTGTDTFTYAAYDGAKNSRLATGTITVGSNSTAQPPVITLNPVSQTVVQGAAVTLTVAATGTAPLSYQWYKNGAAYAGATNPSLLIPAATSADAGSYYAVVKNSAGSATSSTAMLTVTSSAPSVSSFSPSSGTVGTTVTITGANFSGATGVRFNGVTASGFTVVSATQITATVPSGATTGTISVTTPAGTATSSSSFTVVQPPPVIAGFTPASGPVGTTVTVAGSYFTGATQVTFNGVNAYFSVVSATQITASVPSGATTGKITVKTQGGTATSSSSFTVVPAPAISSFTPTSGGVGTAVTVTGANFTGVTQVKFNGVSAPFTVISDTTIVTGVPTGATTGRITVTTAGGTATSSSNFSVGSKTVSPRISGFSPTSGPVGTAITVSGTNLGGVTTAKVGGVAAPFTVSSASRIVITVPTGAKSGRISVTTAGGTDTSSSSFKVLQ